MSDHQRTDRSTLATHADGGNLAVRLEQLAAHHGWLEQTAYIEGAQHYTYGEVYDSSRRAAAGLLELGVQRGERFCSHCRTESTSSQHFSLYYGSVRWLCP